MTGQQSASGWKRFWEKGGWWRALLLVVVYLVLYQGGSFLFGPLIAGVPKSNAALSVIVSYAVPIAFASVLIVVFALSVGWLRELFGPQPIRGKGWMWIAVAVVLLFNVLHFASIDYGKAGSAVVIAWLVAGLFIGFAEETVTRGLVVNLMRKGGHREITVALVSAALFALLHASNLLGGQSLFATLIQLVYTFAFGLCMYLALRVTGNLIWPILLHASTDPSIFMQGLYPAHGALGGIAGMGNIAVIVTGLVLLIFIRGRVSPEPGSTVPTSR